ncbi:hypothetical protein E8E14_003518 [Neopestalotiopsis sp. 37M]|nr:hypothetical protein E8E14_003518 [Neopestalotiopsis sp. 37M]
MANPYNNPLDTSQDGVYGGFVPRNRSSFSATDALPPVSPPSLSNIMPLLPLNPPQGGYSELYTTHHSYIRTGSGAADSDRNVMPSEGTAPGLRQQTSSFPSFSRAFEMFMNPIGDSAWPTRHRNNGHFVPSYLANSAYIQKLEEVHTSKQAQREAQTQATGSSGMTTGQAATPSVTSKPNSHLGMTYDLIERPPLIEDDEAVSPLPTRWNKEDKQGQLEVMADGLEVKYTGQKSPGERDYELYSIRADHPVPSQAGIYYFEVQLLSRKRDENGVNLGPAAKDFKGKLYPFIGMKRNGEHVRTNFGQTPFNFDIDSMMKQEQIKIQKDISEANVARLAGPKTGETDLLQQLVLQFLQHDGYVETARAFAEEIQSEKQALNLDPKVPVEGINIKDDEDANHRQSIRKSILDGDVDKAFKYTQAFYPDVLKENQQVYFKLRCRKFIEMVRRSSYLSNNHNRSFSSKKSNGHTLDDNLEMDLDEDGYSDEMDTQDTLEASTEDEAAEYLAQTITYGRELQEEFKDNASKDMSKTLQDVFALMAYANPLQEKDLAHFFDRKARVLVAEELNSAILLSLGRSSRSALETVYAQTSVLLDYLRENGGPGSFVTVHSVIDEIPKSPY